MSSVPRPNWELSDASELSAIVILGAIAVLALAYMARVARQERAIYPYFMFAGSALAVVYEPINNVLGLCTYPETGQITWISTLGRDIPLYIGFVYFFYMSAPVLYIMRRIRSGITWRQWWIGYFSLALVCTCYELIPINALHWWEYYGDGQGLRVLGFPMWWWFANPMCLFGLATLIHFLRQSVLDDKRSFLLVPLYPMALFAIHGGAALPIFTALNSTQDRWITTPAAMASIALSWMLMYLFGKLVTRERDAVPGHEPMPVGRAREPELVAR